MNPNSPPILLWSPNSSTSMSYKKLGSREEKYKFNYQWPHCDPLPLMVIGPWKSQAFPLFLAWMKFCISFINHVNRQGQTSALLTLQFVSKLLKVCTMFFANLCSFQYFPLFFLDIGQYNKGRVNEKFRKAGICSTRYVAQNSIF